jgi:chromate transporter
MKGKKLYWNLFISTFQLSAFTFGGGYVIVPLMRKKFVEDKHWIDEKEMMDLTAIAQSSPGAMAVNASILIGYRIAGMIGAFITILGTVLPPLIILSIISLFYTAFRDNIVVNLIMKGMQAGVAAVIFDVVITMGQTVLSLRKWLPVFILISSFIAAYFFDVNVILIILACGILGAVNTYHEEKARKEHS